MQGTETGVYVGRASIKGGLGYLILSGLVMVFGLTGLLADASVGLATMAVGLLIASFGYYPVISSEYTLTNTHAKTRYGLIGRNVSDIEIADIRNVQIHQTALGHMFNFGSVLISTAGQSGFEIVFRNVDRPEEIAEMVRRARKRLEK